MANLLLLIVFWVLLTYLLLPEAASDLTRLYVPGYFIGRAYQRRLLGDPVNLALLGRGAGSCRHDAGWMDRADDLS